MHAISNHTPYPYRWRRRRRALGPLIMLVTLLTMGFASARAEHRPQALHAFALEGPGRFVLTANQDTEISPQAADKTWGDETTLYITRGNGGINPWWSLFQFDLALMPPGSRVASAQLHLYTLWSNGLPLTMHLPTQAWAEDADTWNTLANHIDPNPLLTFMPAAANATTVIDVTDVVQQWLDGESDNYGILFKGAVDLADTRFASKESVDTQRWPHLVLEFENGNLQTTADDFDPNTLFNGNDGARSWTGSWLEWGETDGASAGRVRVGGFAECGGGACLRVDGEKTGRGASRQLDLGDAGWAVLSFKMKRTGREGTIDLQSSTDGGATWTTLASYPATTYTGWSAQLIDISASASSQTQIRFMGASGGRVDKSDAYFDEMVVYAFEQSLSGRVWEDVNRNGVVNPSEPGIGQVRVYLYAGACADVGSANSPALYAAAVTRANGDFAFTDATTGENCLMVDETSLAAGLGPAGADMNPRAITLQANGMVAGINFGYASVFASDRLTVGAYAPCTDAGWLQSIAASHDAAIIKADFSTCLFTLAVAPENLNALRADVASNRNTRHDHPDVRGFAAFIPNDPDYSNPSKVYGPQQINAPAAWDLGLGDPDLIVAVIDTGVDATHPEFTGRVLPGWDFVNKDANAADDNGHGTHVAGILAAGINNGIGIAGMAGNVKILPVKVLGADKNGWWSDVAAGVTWAVNQGAKVINLSLAGSVDAPVMHDAVAYANSKGAVVIVAAGNGGTSKPYYPASYNDVIAVAATTYTGGRWTLSNYGPNVDVMAPGGTVYSTTPNNQYATMSGTSMAAPHTSGVAALMLSRNPNLTPAEIKRVLQETVVDMGDAGLDEFYGYGRINAAAAVSSIPFAAWMPPLTSFSAEAGELEGAGATGANAGVVNPGETLRYRIVVANDNPEPLTDVFVSSLIPAYTSYLPGSAQLNGIPLLEDASPATPFPLDESGMNIGSIPAQNSSVVTFDVLVHAPPAGVYTLAAAAKVASATGSEEMALVTEIAGTLLQIDVNKTIAQPGDVLTYTLTSAYVGAELLQNVVITAPIPAGTTYVGDTSMAAQGQETIGMDTTTIGGVFPDVVPTTAFWHLGSVTAGQPGFDPGGGTLTAALTPHALKQPAGRQSSPASLQAPRALSMSNRLAAAPTLVTAGGLITVTQVLTASQDVLDVAPSIPTITVTNGDNTNGVTVALLSGPTPASAAVGSTGTIFTWVYQAFMDAESGSAGHILFGGTATNGETTWPNATSNSVIIHPPLQFQAVIDEPPSVARLHAVAIITDTGGLLPSHVSNSTITYLPASIGDRVWNDADGDHLQDPAEPGITGVGVELLLNTTVVATTTTDALGFYVFDDLDDGVYTVRLQAATVPAIFELVTTAHPLQATIHAGDEERSIDFGLKARGISIGDTIWYDANANGRQDAGEPGLGNVTVALWLDNGDGVFQPQSGPGGDTYTGFTLSNAAGVYRLEAPVAGTYFVDVTDDNGILSGLSHTLGLHSASEPSPPTPVAAGEFDQNVDFGYVHIAARGSAVVGDLVWLDANSDGVRQMAESVLVGITVCATPIGGGAGDAICQETDGNGRFLLILPEGEYNIAPQTLPPGLAPITPSPLQFTVSAGAQLLTLDFGFGADSAPTGRIGGEVWQDLPAQGIYDGLRDPSTEPGLPNVSTDLILDQNADGVWNAGEPYIATMTTLEGDYAFGGLLSGTYLVRVSDTFQVLRNFTPLFATLSASSSIDGASKEQPHPILLEPGAVVTSADFGYREYAVFGAGAPPEPGMIGDQVWEDVDGNGIYSTAIDRPLPGVTVRLQSLDGEPDRSATTGLDGRYLFSDLPLGAYSVSVTDDFAVLAGYQPTLPGPDAQTQPYVASLTTRLEQSVGTTRLEQSARLLQSEEAVTSGADFGYTIPVPFGGVVFFDVNGSGAHDPGSEMGLSDIPITLHRLDTNQEWVATSASLGGAYTFDPMLPGNYVVSAPAVVSGMVLTTASAVTQTLVSGQAALEINFGYIAPTSVQLAAFAAIENERVILRWTTSSEQGLDGFRILRATARDGSYKVVSPIIPAQNLPNGASYIWMDSTVSADTGYWYTIESLPDGDRFGPFPIQPAVRSAGARLFIPLTVRQHRPVR